MAFLVWQNRYGVSLIGGDTTRGSLTITVQVIGTLDEGHILYRNTAQVGDGIYVTGRVAETALIMLCEDALKAYPPKPCSMPETDATTYG